MLSQRTLTKSASKVAPAMRSQARVNALPQRLSHTVRIQQQTRNSGTANNKKDVDMGGPGGQEVYPASNQKHRQYATTAAVATVSALGIMYMMGREDKPKTSPAA